MLVFSTLHPYGNGSAFWVAMSPYLEGSLNEPKIGRVRPEDLQLHDIAWICIYIYMCTYAKILWIPGIRNNDEGRNTAIARNRTIQQKKYIYR